MKVNHEYLKGLLEAFEQSERAFTDIFELKRLGFASDSPEFTFHMLLLRDNHYIEGYGYEGRIGFELGGDRTHLWSPKPLRLTAKGHDYIANLHEPCVWEEIQKNFKESSIDTVSSVAKELVKNLIKKKINEYLS